MSIHVNLTEDGTKKYPLHKHRHWEIMYYLQGDGYLRTPEKNYSFSPQTIIIVPPGIIHGSVSENGFKNISVGGNFGHLLYLDKPYVLKDNQNQDGKTLSGLILNNQYGNNEYLSSLCMTYVHFLLQNLQTEDSISTAVERIVSEITENAFDPNIKLTDFLTKSGYAEDYIRSHFKSITGCTPTQFLTKIRIDRACFLINIYANACSLSQIAEQCGYLDYVYFSKKFKQVMKMSPKSYRELIRK
ncbi:MAG: helix-turn-helix transcriptional regulator [Clostridia bacterium]|nr:helix-turn-helix transcriptional regulator [Clostridia bacterium]